MDATGDEQIREWRRDLHQRPELGFAERDTGDYLSAALEAMGLEVHRGMGGTGVVASLTAGTGTGAIGLRADMDGLALEERGNVPYRSRNQGAMHACGHDGHMAMVLGAAQRLADAPNFSGTVHFIFQPAEEHGRGAKAMISDGLFGRFPMDAIFGLHNMPGMPAGHLRTRSGGIMASEDNFEIRIHGRGGHAARPHMVIDPIVIGAEVVLALQSVVSRSIDPGHAAVISCTEFITDGVRNAIPGEVIIRGDTRSYTAQVQSVLEKRMRELCEGICAAHGASCTFTYTHEFEPTINDSGSTDLAVAAAIAAVGSRNVESDTQPIMASEDFGAFAQVVPGCFSFIGNGVDPGHGGDPLHSPHYDFNDDVLDVGVRFYTEVARVALPVVSAT